MYEEIIKFMMTNVIPGLVLKYYDDDFYPIILGGTDLYRCVYQSGNFDPKFSMPLTDIDLKFITKDTSDERLYKVHASRMEMILEIQQKYNVLKPPNFPELIISRLNKNLSWRVTVFYKENEKKLVYNVS